MKNKPTAEQIAAEVKWLRDNKRKVRRLTAFGDNNHEAIEAQIEVLTDDMGEDEIYEKQDAGDWPETISEAALQVRQWMDGDEEISPSKGWESLVKPND